MSRESIDIALRAMDLNRSGPASETVEPALALTHQDCTFTSRLSSVEGSAYHGREGVRRYFEDIADAFLEWRNEAGEITAVGPGTVVIDVVFRGTSKSGVSVELASAVVFVISAGTVVEMHAFPSREEALEAARLRVEG
jgi:ketosteroid isomerase-like protein